MNKKQYEDNTDVKTQQFNVLAVPYNKAFVVLREKQEELKKSKLNLEVIKQMEEMSKKFKDNNLVDNASVLKKTKKQINYN